MKKKWKLEKGLVPYSSIVSQLAELTGLSIQQARNVADTLVDIVTDEVAEGNRVRISRLGSFYPVKWEGRTVDFGKGPIEVEKRSIVMYNASKDFRERVKELE